MRLDGEPVAEQRPYLVGHHHRAGLGQCLEAGGDVDRVAVEVALVAVDEDHPLVHRHASLDGGARLPYELVRQRAEGGQELEGAGHRPVDVVLVGLREAEGGQDAIAPERDDRAGIAVLEHLSAELLVADQHGVVLLGLQPGGQLRGADEVAEHDREAAELGRGSGGRRSHLASVDVPRIAAEHLVGQGGGSVAVAAVEGGHGAVEQRIDRLPARHPRNLPAIAAAIGSNAITRSGGSADPRR